MMRLLKGRGGRDVGYEVEVGVVVVKGEVEESEVNLFLGVIFFVVDEDVGCRFSLCVVEVGRDDGVVVNGGLGGEVEIVGGVGLVEWVDGREGIVEGVVDICGVDGGEDESVDVKDEVGGEGENVEVGEEKKSEDRLVDFVVVV